MHRYPETRRIPENEIVAALGQLLQKPPGTKIALGIGDDAAAWRPSRSNLSVITTDALVEDVHFTRAHFSFEQIGHRALASNLSDIAAMGARPVLATVALGIPPEAAANDVLQLYSGIDALARRTKTAIVGGDLVRASAYVISITVVGEVRPTHLKRRSSARSGDVLAVTGLLGASRAGLDALVRADVLSGGALDEALRKHHTPDPRLDEGRWLAASHCVHAMMDLSDGIASDVPRLAAASGLRADLDNIPCAASALVMAQHLQADSWLYVAAGGEDFELLVAVAPRAFGYLRGRFEKRFGGTLHAIGRLHEGTGVTLRNGKSVVPLQANGWDHIAQ